MSAKTKTLFILHYSPPIHGASKVGDTIVASEDIKNAFNARFIKIKSSDTLDEIGTIKIKKIWLLIELFFNVIFFLIAFRPDRIYYTASPNGFAFYRDLVIMSPIKLYAFIAGIRQKTKIYLHYHAKGIKDYTSSSSISKALTELLIKNTFIIFISNIMRSEVENLKAHNDVFILNNGVPIALTDGEFEISLNNKIKSKEINVLYLSNMMKDKGYDRVLEIAKTQKRLNNEKIHFNFAGSWSTKEDQVFFEQFVTENDLENMVTYHGLVSGEVKKNLFRTSNLFVFPTTYKKEVFPLSILEALSYGLPVFTFNTGAINEIMNSEIGFVSEEKSFVEDFEVFKKRYLNPDYYRLCRKHFLDNYTEAIFVKELISILKA